MPELRTRELHLRMQDSTNVRTSEKQRLLRSRYETGMQELNTALLEAMEEQIEINSSTRQVQIHRLAELIERKAELEVNIFQAIRGVEKVYDNMKEDFVAVLKGRLDDVRKGIVGVEETGWGGEDEVGIEGQGGEGGA